MQSLCTYAVFAFAGLIAVDSVRAGDLNPPIGPVAPTMKDLETVEPRIPIGPDTTPGDADSLYKITQPGSYYFTGNITGVPDKKGIEVEAHGVSIDLMGFTLRGVPGSLDGITFGDSTVDNIRIENGIIREFSGSGVAFGVGEDFYLRDLQCIECGTGGLIVNASGVVESCIARENGVVGIHVIGGRGVIRGCASHGNDFHGIRGGEGASIINCTAHSNGGDGFLCSFSSSVLACTAVGNGGRGFVVSANSTLMGSSAYLNGDDGLALNGSSSVIGFSSFTNGGDGIQVGSDSSILNCNCDSNGNGAGDGAGIHVTGTDNRIEGNNCTDNDRGIDVDTSGNFIVRNTCSGNATNWDIAANNVVGPILNRSAPGSAAILGDSGADSTASTHPNTNFTY